jgi:hypothetical protein
MNSKQIKFCEEYIEHFNIPDAYMAAGYSPKDKLSAHSCGLGLLKDLKVRTYINYLSAQQSEIEVFNKFYIKNKLKHVANAAMSAAPVLRYDHKSGKMVQAVSEEGQAMYQADFLSSVKALELMGKSIGMFDRQVIPDKTTTLNEEQYQELKNKADDLLRLQRQELTGGQVGSNTYIPNNPATEFL